MPDRGYWSRVRNGHNVQPIPLEGVTEPVHFVNETELSFKVPDRLNNPDQLTLAAKRGLEIARQDKYFVYTDDGQFPMRVAKNNVSRALRILDTLIKCWRRRGYRIELQDRQAFIWLREVRQRISIWEIAKADPRHKAGERKKMLPTGRLALKMDWWGGRAWRDGAAPLEDQIRNILDHMEQSARQLEREKENVVKVPVTVVNVEEPIAQPVTITQVAELSPITELIAEAELWKGLKAVDEYLTALELTVPHTPEFLNWLANAKELRKANDPLINRITKS